MISRIRGKIGVFQEFLAKPFILLNINPNFISLFGLVLALIGAFFVIQQNWLVAFVFFLFAPIMDLIDGTVARKLGKQSNWGNYFETMVDKFVDFVMLGSFVFVPGLEVASVLALGFSMISSYAKPRVGLIIITDNRDWPAIGEHADKLVLLLIGLFFAVIGYNYLVLFLYLIALIAAIGSIQRMSYARGLILEAEKKGSLLPYLRKRKNK